MITCKFGHHFFLDGLAKNPKKLTKLLHLMRQAGADGAARSLQQVRPHLYRMGDVLRGELDDLTGHDLDLLGDGSLGTLAGINFNTAELDALVGARISSM